MLTLRCFCIRESAATTRSLLSSPIARPNVARHFTDIIAAAGMQQQTCTPSPQKTSVMQKEKDSSSFDIGMLIAFHNVVVHVLALTSSVLFGNGDVGLFVLQSRDLLEDVIRAFIVRYGIGYIYQQQSSALSSKKKRKLVDYDRERASKCVRSDWFCPYPRFDDRQFERTFRLTRSMVERLVCSLADYDSFWLSSVDCCGRMTIDPIVKFLAAQKMICFGVSFLAFKDYFQMGESTARLCLEKFTRGIVKCTAISELYLRAPTKSDARRIVSLHKKVYRIDGCLGSLDVTKIHWSACPVAASTNNSPQGMLGPPPSLPKHRQPVCPGQRLEGRSPGHKRVAPLQRAQTPPPFLCAHA